MTEKEKGGGKGERGGGKGGAIEREMRQRKRFP